MTGFDPTLRLTTHRLVLRPFDRGDVDVLASAVAADREMGRWMVWAPGYDREEAVRWCEQAAHEDPANALHRAIVPRSGGPLCGGIGLVRVELYVATGNRASRRVAAKAGFTREGVLRQARPAPGGRTDMIVYGLLRDDPGAPSPEPP